MTNPKLMEIIEKVVDIYEQRDEVMEFGDFYALITGVYGKKCRVLSEEEAAGHQMALAKAGVYAISEDETDRAVSYNHGLRLGRHMRFYVNAHDADSSVEIVKGLAPRIDDREYKIKLISQDKAGYDCLDNVVLYVPLNDCLEFHAKLLQGLASEHPEHFDDETLFTARRIGRGISYATSVPLWRCAILGQEFIQDRYQNKFSFNGLHALVLKRTFDAAIDRMIEDLDELTALYAQALKDARFDPERIHLNSLNRDPLERLEIR